MTTSHRPPPGSTVRALALPAGFALLLVAMLLVPTIGAERHLRMSFAGTAAALLLWCGILFERCRRQRRSLSFVVVLRKQHYLQACAHISILLYWGWYWRPVYDEAPLIVGQLVFAYAFDMLLAWTRRDVYTLGFGPFPIVFSTNLFLWFKPQWFYLQFAMVGIGFAAKELIRWRKNGTLTHVFNPSSFTLMLFSLALLATGRTDITWGPEIATTQLNPPHIFLWIFLASLTGQILFGVAAMTWAAAATAYACAGIYFAATGMHFFPERPVPIAVFLGMHLLFTDPSTAPRTELGRLVFGVLYGLGVVALLAGLTALGLPTFYDKLLPVPILNLLIQHFDRLATSNALAWLDPSPLGRRLSPIRRNLVYVSLWASTFVVMQVVTGDDALLVRADSLFSQRRVDEAIARYRQFIAARPDDYEGRNNLGVALLETGRVDEAIASFERATQLRPELGGPLDNLGVALLRAGRASEAIAALTEARKLRPSSLEIDGHLGQALLQAGRTDDGLELLRRAVAQRPNDVSTNDDYGLGLMQAGRLQDAVVVLRRSVELSPDVPHVLNNLGVALLRAGRPADAVAPLQRAVTLDPAGVAAADNLAHAFMQSGRAESAIELFRRTLAREPADIDVLNNLGLAEMQAGRYDDAAGALQRVAELQPGRFQAHHNLGVALMQAGRFDAAAQAFRRAVDLQPEDAQARDSLGQALMQAGHLEEAVAALNEAIRAKPGEAVFRYHLATALAAAGQRSAAREQLRIVLHMQPDLGDAATMLTTLESADR